jgi:cbb3-type cytochrome oxidase subunit 3
MNHESDLIAAFAVLFFAVMFWAYSADHRVEFTGLASAMGGYIETDGQ